MFDPIHLGHTQFIRKSIKENKLDKVYVLIEREPKFKKCIAAYKHRKEMVSLATSGMESVEIYEAKSPYFPITSALPEIRKSNPEAMFFLLAGDDVARHIDKWEDADKLKDVSIIVARRGTGEDYSDVSSLKAREKIKANRTPELDARVLEYCRANKLY